MREDIRIRRATKHDSRDLAQLAKRTFVDAFSDHNDPADMSAYVDRYFSPQRLRRELDDPMNTFLLASVEVHGDLLGYAKLRRGKANVAVRGPAPVQIERVYVDRAVLGAGVGAALMQACVDRAHKAGFETLWLGVWEHNEKALEFYRRWRFRAVGKHSFKLGKDRQVDIIMERPVTLVALA